ncbi:MAG: flavodoxin domain-containing protein [Dehalococcoidales bacterium]|nr:flavodoxin domain-containing protein [Dehalococcoidales bacterium]
MTGTGFRNKFEEVRALKIILVYDTAYGNTEKIARAVADGMASTGEVRLVRADKIQVNELKGADLIMIGSPTQGFRPLAPVQKLLEDIPVNSLKGIKAAAFDTRIAGEEAKGAGRFIARIGGYAASRIAGALKRKGLDLIAEPEGFNVNDTKGPLGQGELERAAEWGKKVAASVKVKVQ